MPEISRFFGIIIRMYTAEKEHNPPHFHADYNEYEAMFSIDPLEQIKGKLPPRIYGVVMEWALIHQKELMNNWNRLQNEQSIKKIKPLV
jgi:hypothetical protein